MGNGEMENQQENYDLKVMASIFMNTDGKALQSRREELSLSQLEVAEMANIPLYKYQQFESGERKLQNASINTSIAICDVLELKEQRFFLTIIGLIHPKYDDDYEPSKPASPFAEWGFVNIERANQILQNQRKALGLSQQQVADRAGITLRQYRRLESGEQSLYATSMRIGLAVCAALEVDPRRFSPIMPVIMNSSSDEE